MTEPAKNPRHVRALESLRSALTSIEDARENLDPGHPDFDVIDDVHADLRYAVLRLEGRMTTQ